MRAIDTAGRPGRESRFFPGYTADRPAHPSRGRSGSPCSAGSGCLWLVLAGGHVRGRPAGRARRVPVVRRRSCWGCPAPSPTPPPPGDGLVAWLVGVLSASAILTFARPEGRHRALGRVGRCTHALARAGPRIRRTAGRARSSASGSPCWSPRSCSIAAVVASDLRVRCSCSAIGDRCCSSAGSRASGGGGWIGPRPAGADRTTIRPRPARGTPRRRRAGPRTARRAWRRPRRSAMKWGMRLVSLDPGRDAASRSPRSAASTAAGSRSRRVRSSRARWRSSDPGGTARTGTRRLLRLVDVGVDPDDPPLAGIELALVAIRGVGDLALRVALADRGDHPAPPVDLVEVAPHLALGLVGQGLDEPRPTERIDRRVDAALLGDDLLLAEGQEGRLGRRHGERLVVGVGVERLRPAEDAGQRLERHAGQVVERLLRRQRHPGRLGVEAHPGGALVLGAVALGHQVVPDAPAGPELGDLLEEVASGC